MKKFSGMDLQLFGMKNPDLLKQQKVEIVNKINQAVKDGDEEAFAAAFTAYTDMLQEAVLAEAKGLVQAADNQILAGRGVRSLTSEETKYYQGLIGALKSGNPKQALADFNVILPKTVIDAVFEDLTEDHPLLDVINFMPTGALVEILVNTQDGRHLATWSQLCAEIVKELTAGFKKLDLTQKKLSAFLPICKAMLDLGPEWLDRYVRAVLSEAIANGLEGGIIDGSGLDEPTGMRRDPNSALDPVDGYGLIASIPFNEISPATYGGLLAELSVSPNGLNRKISEVIFIVNPLDYFTKIMPATSFRRPDGTYAYDIFPFPTRVIQSVYQPVNEAIIGIPKRYFMGLGTSKGGKVEYSDEYRFLEDERVYLAKLYGNGMPLDSRSFRRLDITDLRTVYPIVRTTPYVDARLDSLTVAGGVVEISPAFNADVHYYVAATANATDKVDVTLKDSAATATATLNGVTATLGEAQTWVEGQNVIVITTSNGGVEETYILVVTYTVEA